MSLDVQLWHLIGDDLSSLPSELEAAPCLPKSCGCGRIHDAFAWIALPYVGVMADDVESLELRNCACGSTLAIAVPS